MPKVSYILATNQKLDVCMTVINSILDLPKHDREFVICCHRNLVESKHETLISSNGIKIIYDDKCTGSVYAFNHAYKYTDGDYVSLVVDDIAYPTNFLDMLDFMQSPMIKNKRFKISNILWDGGPGLYTYGHDSLPDGKSLYPIDGKSNPVKASLCPYSIIPLPFFSRETIDKELQGYIFNPKFNHHFCDGWLGFYCSKQETHEPFKWRCPSIRYIHLQSNSRTDMRFDPQDSNELRLLANAFEQGERKYV